MTELSIIEFGIIKVCLSYVSIIVHRISILFTMPSAITIPFSYTFIFWFILKGLDKDSTNPDTIFPRGFCAIIPNKAIPKDDDINNLWAINDDSGIRDTSYAINVMIINIFKIEFEKCSIIFLHFFSKILNIKFDKYMEDTIIIIGIIIFIKDIHITFL